jgi:Ca-activated chloride channel family protein
MNYADPGYLPCVIWSAVFLLFFYAWASSRRRRLAERFAEKNLMHDITPSMSAAKRRLKSALVAIAFLLGVYALARPQWGFEWEELKRSGLDMLVAIDVSKSMLAPDVKPNRLERSKLAVKDMMKKLSGDRIGLIAFSGTAFLQCPLTIDYNGFILSLDDLGPGTIPRSGTSLEGAIKEAMNVLKGTDKKYKVLVIITDGEELEGSAQGLAKEAAAQGIKIY